MNRLRFVLAVLAGVAGAAPTFADEPAALQRFQAEHPLAQVHLRAEAPVPALVTGLDLELPPGAVEPALARLLAGWSDVLGFEPGATSFDAPRIVGSAHATAFRYAQRHQGLPVLEADVALSVTERGHLTMIGNGAQRIGPIPVEFTLSSSAALRLARAHLGVRSGPSGRESLREVVASVDGEWRAAWEVRLFTSKPLGDWRILVDARAPQVLRQENLMRTALPQGLAYIDSPELEPGGPSQVSLENLTSTTALSGDYLDMYSDCDVSGYGGSACSDSDREATPSASGDYLIAPAASESDVENPFAEVHTYFHLNQMHDYFKTTDSFAGLDYTMPAAVNYTDASQGMNCNAAYGSKTIMVGLCDVSTAIPGATGWVNFAYDAIVVMHEYTHGAVDASAALAMYSTDDWGLVAQHVGLNEGFADYFPAVVLDDPLIGRHVAPAFGMSTSLRDLDDGKSCPANLDGEPHEDGKMWSTANWEAYKASSKDPTLPQAIFQGLTGLSTTPTFQDAANGVLAAAASGGYSQAVQDALTAAYQAHGLLGCARAVSVASGETLTGEVFEPSSLGVAGMNTPFLAQYVLDVPAGAGSLSLAISAIDDQNNPTFNVHVYVNQGVHVSFRSSGTTAQWSSTGPTLTIPNPAPGPYYILPLGHFSQYSNAALYRFTITPAWQLGGADAGVEEPDAAEPAGPDAAEAGPDAAEPGPDAALAGLDAAAAGADAASEKPAGEDAHAIAARPDAGAVIAHLDAGEGASTGGCSSAGGGRGGGGLALILALVGVGLLRRRA